MGHMAKDCRAPRQQQQRFGRPQRCRRVGHRVGAVSYRRLGPVPEEDEAQASGYKPHTASCINNIPVGSHTTSPFAQRRKLSAVFVEINGIYISHILIDSGSPVTIVRVDLWEKVRGDKFIVEEEPEDFQGVTRDGLRITRLLHKFGGLLVTHPVVIAESIAQKFILGNDFMIEHKCNIINSDGVIQFGGQRVPFTLFRSTVNLICPVICTGSTIIGPNEEAVVPCLLDAACQYEKDSLCFWNLEIPTSWNL